jgi:hypothetical protein
MARGGGGIYGAAQLARYVAQYGRMPRQASRAAAPLANWTELWGGPSGGYQPWQLFPSTYWDALDNIGNLATQQLNANSNILQSMLYSPYATRDSIEFALGEIYSGNNYRTPYRDLANTVRMSGVNIGGYSASWNMASRSASWSYTGGRGGSGGSAEGPDLEWYSAITYNNLRTAPRGPIQNTILSNAGA